MTFIGFQEKVNGLIMSAGGGITANFTHDEDAGKYIASCSDGTTISMNPLSLSMTVRWGSGHEAVV